MLNTFSFKRRRFNVFFLYISKDLLGYIVLFALNFDKEAALRTPAHLFFVLDPCV